MQSNLNKVQWPHMGALHGALSNSTPNPKEWFRGTSRHPTELSVVLPPHMTHNVGKRQQP
jgi:hypothetical protein